MQNNYFVSLPQCQHIKHEQWYTSELKHIFHTGKTIISILQKYTHSDRAIYLTRHVCLAGVGISKHDIKNVQKRRKPNISVKLNINWAQNAPRMLHFAYQNQKVSRGSMPPDPPRQASRLRRSQRHIYMQLLLGPRILLLLGLVKTLCGQTIKEISALSGGLLVWQ